MNKRIITLIALVFPLWALTSRAEDITIRFNGATAKVQQQIKDSVQVEVDGAHVSITSAFQAHKLTILMSGKSEDGQLILKTDGKASVKLKGLSLTSQEGAPLWLKNKKKVEIDVADGSENTLTVTACNDTANHKGAVIWAKDKIKFSGKGTLNIIATGDGCRGIKTQKDITIENLTLNVTTSGNHLGEKPFGFGNFGGGEMPDFGGFGGGFGGFGAPNDSTRQGGFGGFQMGGFGGGMPNFGNLSEEDQARIEEMRKTFEERMQNGEGFGGFGGGMPNFGGGGMPDFGGFGGGFGGFGNPGGEGEEDEDGGMGFGGKHKYVASTKGIASKGKITINSGKVTVKTSTAGAEGIEGKEGVVVNGGIVDVLSPDDAINAKLSSSMEVPSLPEAGATMPSIPTPRVVSSCHLEATTALRRTPIPPSSSQVEPSMHGARQVHPKKDWIVTLPHSSSKAALSSLLEEAWVKCHPSPPTKHPSNPLPFSSTSTL